MTEVRRYQQSNHVPQVAIVIILAAHFHLTNLTQWKYDIFAFQLHYFQLRKGNQNQIHCKFDVNIIHIEREREFRHRVECVCTMAKRTLLTECKNCHHADTGIIVCRASRYLVNYSIRCLSLACMRGTDDLKNAIYRLKENDEHVII